MKTSESINEIAQALCKFQSEIKDAHKDTQAHKYKYADLGSVLQLLRPVMTAHGLSVVQMPCNDGDRVGVTTRLMHNSGEWMESTLFMAVSANAGMSLAQAAGSVITYARRYSLASALGITQVDEDAAVVAPKPQVKMASEAQRILIKDYQEAGQIAEKTLPWLEKHWDSLTAEQATKIINHAKEQSK